MKGMFCEEIHALEDVYKDQHTREVLPWSQGLLQSS
jgi:hypothetical protein